MDSETPPWLNKSFLEAALQGGEGQPRVEVTDKMDSETPPWLNKSFLEAALQGGEGQPRVEVTEFWTCSALPAGTNYISHIFRVKVLYRVGTSEETTSLILKAPSQSEAVAEFAKECNQYVRETAIYCKVLPMLHTSLKCTLTPKLFFSRVKDVLVFEDLKEKGYVMCDRQKQLDLAHCRQVFVTLAKFHAASVVCKRDHPDLIDAVSEEILFANTVNFNKNFIPWIQRSFEMFVSIVREMGLGKPAEDLFRSRIDSAADSVLKLCKPKKNGLNVLNHGDPWTNNILFKHDASGSIEDVKLIDFQLTRYTSPVLDLNYFIWSSANEDVRDNKLPELCELYRCTLNSTLEQLGCQDRLSEEEFHEDLKAAKDWAITLIGLFLPIFLSENGNNSNVENKSGIFLDNFGGFELFNGKCFRAKFPKLSGHLQNWMLYCK